MKKNKVFGIGFHRTGTTTFQTCLEALGYDVIGMRDSEWKAYSTNDLKSIDKAINTYDGFRDMPWPLLYKYIHNKYPSAKFVLSYREPTSWLKSCAGNYKNDYYSMFKEIYGFNSFIGNEDKAKDIYLEHINNVRSYFSDKPDIFLEKDFTKDHTWTDLCSFLSEPDPNRDFPHANKRPKSFHSKLFHRIYKIIAPASYKSWVRDKI